MNRSRSSARTSSSPLSRRSAAASAPASGAEPSRTRLTHSRTPNRPSTSSSSARTSRDGPSSGRASSSRSADRSSDVGASARSTTAACCRSCSPVDASASSPDTDTTVCTSDAHPRVGGVLRGDAAGHLERVLPAARDLVGARQDADRVDGRRPGVVLVGHRPQEADVGGVQVPHQVEDRVGTGGGVDEERLGAGGHLAPGRPDAGGVDEGEPLEPRRSASRRRAGPPRRRTGRRGRCGSAHRRGRTAPAPAPRRAGSAHARVAGPLT